jgi:hypothetical protein
MMKIKDVISKTTHKGTYKVYGYYNNFLKKLLPWDSLTDPEYNIIKENCPTKIVLNTNSVIITGGVGHDQTFFTRTHGNTLYFLYNGAETIIGTFNSGDLHWTYGLEPVIFSSYHKLSSGDSAWTYEPEHASESAYILYKKL